MLEFVLLLRAMTTETRGILLLATARNVARKTFHRVTSVPLKSAFYPLGITSIPALVAHFQHKKGLLKRHPSISKSSFTWEFSACHFSGCEGGADTTTFAQIMLGISKYHFEISSWITSGQISQVIYSERQLTLQIILQLLQHFFRASG